jgi:hypothetical protein
MTYRPNFTLPGEILELVNDNGFDILPELLRLIFNTAMSLDGRDVARSGTRKTSRCRTLPTFS